MMERISNEDWDVMKAHYIRELDEYTKFNGMELDIASPPKTPAQSSTGSVELLQPITNKIDNNINFFILVLD